MPISLSLAESFVAGMRLLGPLSVICSPVRQRAFVYVRLQSTADNQLRAYIAQGEVLPVATRSFGSIGIFAIPQMGRFYRHVLIEKNFPHHGAVAFGHFGKELYEVFRYLGVAPQEIGYNHPQGVLYPTENPFAR